MKGGDRTSPRVLNKRTDAVSSDAVYVGRPTRWGNPYVVGVDGSRDDVIWSYEVYLRGRPSLMAAARRELAGRDLVCWCAPAACHADVLLRIANTSDPAAEVGL